MFRLQIGFSRVGSIGFQGWFAFKRFFVRDIGFLFSFGYWVPYLITDAKKHYPAAMAYRALIEYVVAFLLQ